METVEELLFDVFGRIDTAAASPNNITINDSFYNFYVFGKKSLFEEKKSFLSSDIVFLKVQALYLINNLSLSMALYRTCKVYTTCNIDL